ncbi:hypothetical protein IWQ47_004354 [Aquimarina sp. EL_43]|uniref:DUF4255 domain-containing protein n=1 Tax=unclassified Aquimarina TaxID=2627091 RepID=UPI0018C96E0D|nr:MULTISPECIES: DUF4255 domain-containing protein [unclassified Aquimarina]MBG6132816.1 hypothetical protein [Aquimarina sp. EL_35]MBG6153107.1 hypothetical protein [Aquimarina sp. EL_32]MBG6171263.1 hypothetical protein [Aquimarina sp. EL_43]
MIGKAMSFIEDRTNQYFQGILGPSTEKYAALGNIAKIVEGGDTTDEEGGSGIVITLVNIEEDRISKNPDGIYRQGDKVIRSNPEILVNLYVLFSANLTYTTALSRISSVIQCFQSNNFFTVPKFPSLDEDIMKLHIELYTMNFEQINHLWSTLGGKYLPSVLYKMKLIPISDKDNKIEGSLITEIQTKKSAIAGALK